MNNHAALANQFEHARKQLSAVAFRLLGSADEAEDAVQEAWLRASRADVDGIRNVSAWLTTIVARICLDLLRSRRRQAVPGDINQLQSIVTDDAALPDDTAALTESVGLAMLVVLDRLQPAERIAFVLHDMFEVPFKRIAEILERSQAAAKKLASRARQRLHGTPITPANELRRQWEVVEAFLAASRAGDLDALVRILAPDVVRRADAEGMEGEVRGARRVAEETLTNSGRARFACTAIVNGSIGILVAPQGRLQFVLLLQVVGDHLAAIDVVSDQTRLNELEVIVPVFAH